MVEIISIKNFEDRIKRLEKNNIKKYKKSLSWISMLNKFNKCIIEIQIDKSTLITDKNKYKEIKKSLDLSNNIE